MNKRFLRYPVISFILRGSLLLAAVHYGAMIGCGSDGATRGATVSVALGLSGPSAEDAGLRLNGLKIKGQTAETAQPDREMTLYMTDTSTGEDEALGTCTTDASGNCTISVSQETLGTNPTLFVTSDLGIDAMSSPTVVSDADSEVSIPCDSESDLAMEAYVSGCKDALGSAPRPGEGISNCIAKVIPDCVRKAISSMAGGGISNETTGGEFSALLEAHRTNLAAGISSGSTTPPVDMSAVFSGDATAITGLVNVAGSEISESSALILGGAKRQVSTESAASTAASTLDSIIASLCSDATTYATVTADSTFASDPSSIFNLFSELVPSEVGSIDTTAFRGMFAAIPTLEGGTGYTANPLGARAMIEMFLNGGFGESETDFGKKIGTMMGAGLPSSLAQATEFGRAVPAMFASAAFSGASAADVRGLLGPLLGVTQNRQNWIAGGAAACDQYISNNGGLAGFQSITGSVGTDPTAIANAFPSLKSCGSSCTLTSQCMPPYSCSSGSCKLTGSSSCTGGALASCTSNSECATGFFCDVIHICALSSAQPSNFLTAPVIAEGGTAAPVISGPADGTYFGHCRSTTPQCDSGLSCNSVSQICQTSTTSSCTSGCTAGNLCSSDSVCGTGLFCGNRNSSTAQGSCKTGGSEVSGNYCRQTSDCVSGLTCTAGTCRTSSTVGACTSSCPGGTACNSDSVCGSHFCGGRTSSTGTGSCRADGGMTESGSSYCKTTSNCVSGFSCVANICTTSGGGGGGSLTPNGSSCTSDAACSSGYCGGRTSPTATGLCQMTGTGTAGQYCSASFHCVSTHCTGGLCQI